MYTQMVSGNKSQRIPQAANKTSANPNVIVSGTVQGVSHFVAQVTYQAKDVQKTALKLHSWCGLGLSIIFFTCAPVIASILRDPELTWPLRSAAGIIACYAFYSIFVGVANGKRAFGKQATLDTMFATLRVSAILLSVYLGFGVVGAFLGWTIAAIIILVIAAFWIQTTETQTPHKISATTASPSTPLSQKKMFNYVSQLLIFTLLINLILRTDLFVLKRGTMEILSGASADLSSSVATILSGYYGISQALALIPYQAIFALTFIIFPTLSKAPTTVLTEVEAQSRSNYISQALRFTLILSIAIALPLFIIPEHAIGILYPTRFQSGGFALRFLAFGMVSFSLFSVVCTVLNAISRTKTSIFIAFATTVVSLGCNISAFKLIKSYPLEGSYAASEQASAVVTRLLEQTAILSAPALSTAAATTLGLILSLIALKRYTTASLPKLTTIRVFVAASVPCIAYSLFHQPIDNSLFNGGKLASLTVCMAISLIYGLCLLAMREITSADLSQLKASRKQ